MVLAYSYYTTATGLGPTIKGNAKTSGANFNLGANAQSEHWSQIQSPNLLGGGGGGACWGI